MYRGRDGSRLQLLFKESPTAHGEALLDNHGSQDFIIPSGFYTEVLDAIDFIGNDNKHVLHSLELLHLFEFYRITHVGGTSSPYFYIEWHGIQILQTITSLLRSKEFNFTFINDE